MRHVVMSAAVALVGCGNASFVECLESMNCDRAAGGECRLNPVTGSSWCAYQDSSCSSGVRWSDLDVGDGLRGECVGSALEVDAGASSPGPDASATSPDAMSPDASPPPIMGSWSLPFHVPELNDPDINISDERPTLRPDGLEIFWVRNYSPEREIMTATRTSTTSAWSGVRAIEMIVARPDSPDLSPDGREIYYTNACTSDPTIGRLVRSSLSSPWVSGGGNLFQGDSPSLSNNGLALYYFRDGKIRKRTRGAPLVAWGDEVDVALPSIEQFDVHDFDLSADERVLVFRAGAPQYGTWEFSRDRTGSPWRQPVEVLGRETGSCRLVTGFDMYCAITEIENNTDYSGNIYRFTRGP